MCKSCKSERILSVNAKCSDMCHVQYGDEEHDGYVPREIGIGGGDYIALDICMECGTIQNKLFPVDDEEKIEVLKET